MACRQQRVKGVASILKDRSASHTVGVASSLCKMLPLVNGNFWSKQSFDPSKAGASGETNCKALLAF